jgi:hypothetical protein
MGRWDELSSAVASPFVYRAVSLSRIPFEKRNHMLPRVGFLQECVADDQSKKHRGCTSAITQTSFAFRQCGSPISTFKGFEDEKGRKVQTFLFQSRSYSSSGQSRSQSSSEISASPSSRQRNSLAWRGSKYSAACPAIFRTRSVQ